MRLHFWRWGALLAVGHRILSVERDRRVYFSERYGHRKVHRIGRWAWECHSGRPLSDKELT